ncbi:MAG TPA: hypothetical protein VJP41_07850 [Gaiellaceae bacterium]|nr:hypothetical protein [Gaiellaceae bacterium]
MRARCAWCGRYRIGEGWMLLDELPSFAAVVDVTHGICEDCVPLRASGMSV